jgi:hypothetical protein
MSGRARQVCPRDLDAEFTNGAFNLCVPKQQLDSTQIWTSSEEAGLLAVVRIGAHDPEQTWASSGSATSTDMPIDVGQCTANAIGNL